MIFEVWRSDMHSTPLLFSSSATMLARKCRKRLSNTTVRVLHTNSAVVVWIPTLKKYIVWVSLNALANVRSPHVQFYTCNSRTWRDVGQNVICEIPLFTININEKIVKNRSAWLFLWGSSIIATFVIHTETVGYKLECAFSKFKHMDNFLNSSSPANLERIPNRLLRPLSNAHANSGRHVATPTKASDNMRFWAPIGSCRWLACLIILGSCSALHYASVSLWTEGTQACTRLAVP